MPDGSGADTKRSGAAQAVNARVVLQGISLSLKGYGGAQSRIEFPES
jgi:hypothetical protein